jgi:hypothetical protein
VLVSQNFARWNQTNTLIGRIAGRFMQDTGSGGIGAVSIGISETLIGLIVLVIVLVAVWKLAKILWAVFSG